MEATKDLLDTTLTVQDLGAARPNADYPDWKRYALRTSPGNVCVAEIGHVDRYHEAEYGTFATEIARRWNAAPALLAALEAMVAYNDERYGPATGLPMPEAVSALMVAAREALRLARGA